MPSSSRLFVCLFRHFIIGNLLTLNTRYHRIQKFLQRTSSVLNETCMSQKRQFPKCTTAKVCTFLGNLLKFKTTSTRFVLNILENVQRFEIQNRNLFFFKRSREDFNFFFSNDHARIFFFKRSREDFNFFFFHTTYFARDNPNPNELIYTSLYDLISRF